MQCKSGYAQAGQNKKRRADARLSWDGVKNQPLVEVEVFFFSTALIT